ncbi:unnamed protein product [Arctogadus glacialis]
MRGRFNRKDTYWETDVPTAVEVESPGELSPLPGGSTSSDWPDTPVSGSAHTHPEEPDPPVSGSAHMGLDHPHQKSSDYSLEKRYLGVRVKMPVKDMLRSIRLAQGCDPQELQEKSLKRSKGEKKRVNTCKEHQSNKRKRPNKSLEELAIIVEVLEEDLKMGNTYSSHRPSAASNPSPAFLLSFRSTEPSSPTWGGTPPRYGQASCSSPESGPLSSCGSASDPHSPSSDSMSDGGSSDRLSQCLPSYQQCMAGYHSAADDSDGMIPSPEYTVARSSPGPAEFWRAASPHSPDFAPPGHDLFRHHGVESHCDDIGGLESEWFSSGHGVGQSSGAYFVSQLQREENELEDVCDSRLLATDGQGRMALHRVACLGKRAQGYAIAKRMASIHCLDLKDSEGMTSLHLAARHNQHLMVADLIGLGANANEKDASGKTCLHICAERGYIRVLEVLKQMMSDGVFVDMDATDNYGLSVLQCAALGLSAAVQELEGRACLGRARLHTLRKEQMMETLECLLQMDNCPPAPGGAYRDTAFDVRREMEPDQFMQGLKSYIKKGNSVTKTWSNL